MAITSGLNTDDLFTALGHPLRRQILRKMLRVKRDLSPRDLAEDLDESLSKLSYHVRILSECGAIELVGTRQVRGSTQHFYRPTIAARWVRTALRSKDGR
jgi:DNA-binding transcriptional ArsR family regulator